MPLSLQDNYFLIISVHISDNPPLIRPFWYRFFSISMLVVLVIVVVAVIGGVAWKKKQERNKKRFF